MITDELIDRALRLVAERGGGLYGIARSVVGRRREIGIRAERDEHQLKTSVDCVAIADAGEWNDYSLGSITFVGW